MANVALMPIKAVALGYDVLTLPFYAMVQQPWRRRSKKIRATKVDSGTWVRNSDPPPLILGGDQSNMADVVRVILREHGNRKCLGVRRVVQELQVRGIDGKLVTKKKLAKDFEYMTFEEVNHRIDQLAKGFLEVGIKQHDTVIILMETRLEWTLAAQALFRIGATLGTLYATLGDDGLVFATNQLESSHVITSSDLLAKLIRLAPKMPHIKTVIYANDKANNNEPDIEVEASGLELFTMDEVIIMGDKSSNRLDTISIDSEDKAVIMYTSGSTGTPKGVIMTHKNVISCINALNSVMSQLPPITDEPYPAYLPLAHILEFCLELIVLANGGRICYSSPFTLSDRSPWVVEGEKGDLSLLQPMVMACVPLVLERIKKAIETGLREKGPFVEALFNWAIRYKNFWTARGFQTPILDRVLFKKVRAAMGGRMKYICSGGAPLSSDVQMFFKMVFDTNVQQGYGLTETCAVSTVTDLDDNKTGTVGTPMAYAKIKLIDWEEGGYRVTDKPRPRGEIVVGGDFVSAGYYKLDKETADNFETIDGERWFKTGDIGEVLRDGTFKIIDRKKDLIKLPLGEYISLGKVESAIKGSIFIENVCVFGSGTRNYLIALITPNLVAIKDLAERLNKAHLVFAQICKDRDIVQSVLNSVKSVARERGLTSLETPQKVKLCDEEWTPDSGLVTAALKIRRVQIRQFYEKDISSMFAAS